MTRLPRSAALLVAFCLLVSAATAHAECAWVMWVAMLEHDEKKTAGGKIDEDWHVLKAYDTEGQCAKEVKTADQ